MSGEIWQPDMLPFISTVEHLHFRHGTYILLPISLSHKYMGEGIIKTQYKAMNTNEYQRNTETGGKKKHNQLWWMRDCETVQRHSHKGYIHTVSVPLVWKPQEKHLSIWAHNHQRQNYKIITAL